MIGGGRLCGELDGAFNRQGEIKDLRQNYLELLRQNIRIDPRMLEASLKHFGLPVL